MKLEEGKWYKWYQKNHDNTHIGKLSSESDLSVVRMKPWLISSNTYNASGCFERKFMQDIVEITDLTEISKLLHDRHEDKIVTPKSERYIATMKFFEQLKEPERSQAIENYDENRYGIPSSLSNALMNGFVWGNSKQGYKYWDDIYGAMSKSEVLVFGKYKIGDIVISLTDFKPRCAGGIYEVLKGSKNIVLRYLSSANSDYPNDWRLATPEEVEAYHNGIINISDIKPKSLEGRYIKCLKENDWDDGKTKVGDILKIRKSDSVGDLFIGLECLANSRLRNGEFELLPIDYTPEPVKEQTMFKKGDYIVTLINEGDCGKVNYCSKQREDIEYLSPEIDTKGCTDNGNATFKFSDKSQVRWRFGTKEEGEEYEKHGKPYNVTNLLSSLIPDKPTEYIAKVGDYVEVIDAFNNCFKLGDIVECIAEERFRDRFGFVQVLPPKRYKAVSVGTKLVSNTPSDLITRDVSILNTFISKYDTFDMYGNKVYPLTPKEAYPNYSLPIPTNIILKTKSKSIKL